MKYTFLVQQYACRCLLVSLVFGVPSAVHAAAVSECDPQSEIVNRTDDVANTVNLLTCRAYSQYRFDSVTAAATADVRFIAGDSIAIANGTTLVVQAGAIFSLDVIPIPWGINDTGASKCTSFDQQMIGCPVSGYPDQDGQFGRDKRFPNAADGHAGFSFTKLDANGDPLPADAPDWRCIRDNVTNLIWETKTDAGSDLQYVGSTYTWYNPDPTQNGGHAGTAGGGGCSGGILCDTSAYVAAINALQLCGKNDWQVPTHSQLLGLVRNGDLGGNVRGPNFKPAFENTFFPDTRYKTMWPDQDAEAAGYWTATRTSAGVAGAHYVKFGTGTTSTRNMSEPQFLRLVYDVKGEE